jgi:hypothetical protein
VFGVWCLAPGMRCALCVLPCAFCLVPCACLVCVRFAFCYRRVSRLLTMALTRATEATGVVEISLFLDWRVSVASNTPFQASTLAYTLVVRLTQLVSYAG